MNLFFTIFFFATLLSTDCIPKFTSPTSSLLVTTTPLLSLLRRQPNQLIILRKTTTTTTSFNRHYLLCSPFSPCTRTLFRPLSTIWKWCLRNGTTSLLLLIHHSPFSLLFLSQSYQHTHIFCRTSPQLLCPSLTTNNFSFSSFVTFLIYLLLFPVIPFFFLLPLLLSPVLSLGPLFHSFVQPTAISPP